MSAEQRDAWLVEQCGDDDELLREVPSLLEHDNPDDDPLEKRLDEALRCPAEYAASRCHRRTANRVKAM